MAHLEHIALIVGDYDRAIAFFVDALGSSSSRTPPR
jgi:catechol 2,3-dioxygenase-like lactoylglutathione lyase family enzyme